MSSFFLIFCNWWLERFSGELKSFVFDGKTKLYIYIDKTKTK